MSSAPYVVRRAARSRFVPLRGLAHHVLEWGDVSMATPERPTLLMQHGWMDVAASFQFVVDALAADRHVMAFDWRGFGLSEAPVGDTYWIPDYLGDLDAALDALVPAGNAIDLLGHSMGGNLVMLYAGVRPARIRRLVNLEGYGMPATTPDQAPTRYLQWLDDLKRVPALRDYDDLAGVAGRLRQTNPRLAPERALWLAAHWSRQRPSVEGEPGRFELLADPRHKRNTPLLYQRAEVLACWKLITAKLLMVEADLSESSMRWGTRYDKAEFHERLKVVPELERALISQAGHMLHHDQPGALAAVIERFLDA